LKHGTEYTFDDLLTIAKGQVAMEEKYESLIIGEQRASSKSEDSQPLSPLFIDTNMYVMKVWCEFVFNNCHKWILEEIVKRKYDLYLLCNTDLPWVKDELREYPDLETRETLFKIYKDLMINQEVPWVEISGGNEERLQRAINSVDHLLGR
jgi:nicotinamide riboside kinase